MRGSAYVEGLKQAGAVLTFADSPPLVLAELEARHVAGIVDNGLQVVYQMTTGSHPNLKIVNSYAPFSVNKLAFAVRKEDTELLTKLNASLAKLQTDGTVKSIAAKWGLD